MPKGDGVTEFRAVFASELDCIETRRHILKRADPSYPAEDLPDQPPTDKTKPVDNIVGLALSGGGIRSAGFCLGVLQALDAALSSKSSTKDKTAKQNVNSPTLLERVDYLSTVSGGGYIGCSLAAALSNRRGKFSFASDLTGNGESASIKHVRDYSNYLFPNGFLDVFPNLAIYLRGLFANFIIVLPLLLAAATFTIYCSASSDNLTKPFFYEKIVKKTQFSERVHLPSFDSFGFTKLTLVFFCSLLFLWGLYSIFDKLKAMRFWQIISALIGFAWGGLKRIANRPLAWLQNIRAKVWSFLQGAQDARPQMMAPFAVFIRWLNPNRSASGHNQDARLSEADSSWAKVGGWALIVLAVCAIFEIQPYILNELFERATKSAAAAPTPGGKVAVPDLNFYGSVGVAVLTAIASAIGLLADKLNKVVKYFSQSSGWLAKLVSGSGKSLIYVASAALPLMLWILYLLLSFWGISHAKFENKYAAPDWLRDYASTFWTDIASWVLDLPFAGTVLEGGRWVLRNLNFDLVFDAAVASIGHAVRIVTKDTSPVGGLYFSVGLALILLATLPTLNANSLHRLYRDRLSKAFIFFETTPSSWAPLKAMLLKLPFVSKVVDFFAQAAARRTGGDKSAGAPDGGEIKPLDQFKLTQLQARFGPYLIVNAALNIQGSKYVNQRGRNADFFMFSRNYTGSEATKYVSTHRMQGLSEDLNLATVMAVSGAAASSNMGSNTIRPLTPTLTLLNIRLGYWLRNPRSAGKLINRALASVLEWANFYVFKEMFGLLTERTHNIYLTDGGHIDNLGIYQLLKRRCKLIIAVDAEADPQMNFESFVKLQRYARIDLGTRIELPWQDIRTATIDTGKKIADKDPTVPSYARNGPHCAIGIIEYSDSEYGYLLYIKSSLSGDENDYITDYKRRYPMFPHETTGDQLFSEEQFEVYRALGFHTAHSAFTDSDKIVTLSRGSKRAEKLTWSATRKTRNPMPEIHRILKL